jgi:hypothetical protein
MKLLINKQVEKIKSKLHIINILNMFRIRSGKNMFKKTNRIKIIIKVKFKINFKKVLRKLLLEIFYKDFKVTLFRVRTKWLKLSFLG